MRVRNLLFPLIYGTLASAIVVVWVSVFVLYRSELKR